MVRACSNCRDATRMPLTRRSLCTGRSRSELPVDVAAPRKRPHTVDWRSWQSPSLRWPRRRWSGRSTATGIEPWGLLRSTGRAECAVAVIAPGLQAPFCTANCGDHPRQLRRRRSTCRLPPPVNCGSGSTVADLAVAVGAPGNGRVCPRTWSAGIMTNVAAAQLSEQSASMSSGLDRAAVQHCRACCPPMTSSQRRRGSGQPLRWRRHACQHRRHRRM